MGAPHMAWSTPRHFLPAAIGAAPLPMTVSIDPSFSQLIALLRGGHPTKLYAPIGAGHAILVPAPDPVAAAAEVGRGAASISSSERFRVSKANNT